MPPSRRSPPPWAPALEHRSPVAVEERVYNCYSAKELIDEGLSESTELRLFEVGWSDGKATHFVTAIYRAVGCH
jgi:hypothetical protein